jgi:hypothetical protein
MKSSLHLLITFLPFILNHIGLPSAELHPGLDNYSLNQKQKQKLTADNRPARSLLASGPAGTRGLIFIQSQDLRFSFLLLILLIDTGGLVIFYIDWCSLTTPYST